MKTIALISALFSLSAFAQVDSLIKLYDGGVARCQSKADVYRHRISSVYRPLELKQNADQTFIKIEFLRCVKNNDQYSFVRDYSISRPRIINDELTDGRELSVVKDNFTMIAVNNRGQLIDRSTLEANEDGTYSVVLDIKTEEYELTPTGKSSVEVLVQTRFKISDMNTEEIIDRGTESLGAYRLIIK
ncbi:MAG: hypothetical protein NDI69_13315 [Bacteriovoracaceae bacterium]|nr:hypothetical protein [Bacteriovoracaceae bacterium]